MTDRYYPAGMPAHADAWKTTYELANELNVQPRSRYPPGYSGHLHGTRIKFGYGCPGPEPNNSKIGFEGIPDDMDEMDEFDLMLTKRKLDTQQAQANQAQWTYVPEESPNEAPSQASKRLMRPMSAPALGRGPALSRTTVPPEDARFQFYVPSEQIDKLEDARFNYFVPDALKGLSREKVLERPLSKLERCRKVSMAMSGAGTGYKCEGNSDWWPEVAVRGCTDRWSTESKTSFTKQPYFRPKTAPSRRPASAGGFQQVRQSRPGTAPAHGRPDSAPLKKDSAPLNYAPRPRGRPSSAPMGGRGGGA